MHWPLPWSPEEPFALPFFYRVGIWFALLLGLGLDQQQVIVARLLLDEQLPLGVAFFGWLAIRWRPVSKGW